MSFYRNVMAAVAAICFSTSIFAAAEMNNNAAGQKSSAMQASDAQHGKININTASLQDLMNVKGMNRLKAKSIVRYRNLHLFKSLDELSTVKGFKRMDKESLKAIQEQMSL
jgi:DNA uptake protein ComE-like DNA-binding protein